MTMTLHTRRLRIFRFDIEPTDDFDGLRHVWIAFNTTDGRMPLVCCSAVVNPPGEFPALLCWLETSDVYRRRGYASELLAVLRRHYGTLDGATPDDFATDAGEGFLAAVNSTGDTVFSRMKTEYERA